MKIKYTIWSSDLHIEDFLFELRHEFPDAGEDELYQMAVAENWADRLDIRYIVDEDLGAPILAVADLGLWNGRKNGYKLIKSGNVADCFVEMGNVDDARWYIDDKGELCADFAHHDGVNHIRYRAIRPGMKEKTVRDLCAKIASQEEFERSLSRVTYRIGDRVGAKLGVEACKRTA